MHYSIYELQKRKKKKIKNENKINLPSTRAVTGTTHAAMSN